MQYNNALVDIKSVAHYISSIRCINYINSINFRICELAFRIAQQYVRVERKALSMIDQVFDENFSDPHTIALAVDFYLGGYYFISHKSGLPA